MRSKDKFTDEYDRGRGPSRDRGDYRQAGSREDYRDREFEDREDYPREGYKSREGYQPPSMREGYDRGLRDDRYDRYSTRDPFEGRPEPPYEPRYESRLGRTDYKEPDRVDYGDRGRREYADRERTRWGYQTERSRIRCRDIMTRDVVACRVDSNLREVAKLMRD
jgi:hypothetical protein